MIILQIKLSTIKLNCFVKQYLTYREGKEGYSKQINSWKSNSFLRTQRSRKTRLDCVEKRAGMSRTLALSRKVHCTSVNERKLRKIIYLIQFWWFFLKSIKSILQKKSVMFQLTRLDKRIWFFAGYFSKFYA